MEKPKLYPAILWAACMSSNPPAELRGSLEALITKNVPPPPRQVKATLEYLRRGMKVSDCIQSLLRTSELAAKLIAHLEQLENAQLAEVAEREPLRRAA